MKIIIEKYKDKEGNEYSFEWNEGKLNIYTDASWGIYFYTNEEVKLFCEKIMYFIKKNRLYC